MNYIKQIENNPYQRLKDSSLHFLKNFGLPDNKNEYYRYTKFARLYPNLDQEFSTTDLNVTGDNLSFKELTNEELDNYKKLFIHNKNDFTNDASLALTHGLVNKVFELIITSSSDKPITIDHSSLSNANSSVLIIKVKKNVAATIIENFNAQTKGLLSNATKVLLEPNSNLEHIVIQENHADFNQFNHIESNQKRDSQYKNLCFHFGGKVTRTNIHALLEEPGAECNISGLHVGQNEQNIDTLSFIEHLAPNTNSNQLYKSVLEDTAQSVFTGRIKVHQNAQQTNSNQLNKNLLLSKKAHAHSMPQLEIFADDVKCAHGSTTGQISDQELFYFTARGIDEKKARHMLALGFVNDVILKSDNLELREQLKEKFLFHFKKRLS